MNWSRTWEHNLPFMGTTYTNMVYATVTTVATGADWSTERVRVTIHNNVSVGIQYTSNLTFGGSVKAQQVNVVGIGQTGVIYDFQQTTYRNSSGYATVGFNFRTSVPSYGQVISTGTINILLDYIEPPIPATTITSYTITNKTFTSAQINWATAHQVDRVEFRLGGASQPWQLGTSHTGSSGSFTVTGLSPDYYATTYIRARRVGSSDWTTSTGKPLETLKRAVFTTMPDNIDISQPFTVNFDRKDATDVHVSIRTEDDSAGIVAYQLAEGTSFTFNLTTAEKNAMYDSMATVSSKVFRIAIRTNSVNTWANVSLKSFRVVNGEPTTPIFTHQDTNAITNTLTGSNQAYIQGYSDLEIDVSTATPFRGATITKYIIVNGSNSQEYTSSGVKSVGKATANQLQIIIEDSRKLTSQKIININYIPYTNPTIQNFSLNREIGTSTKADLITNGMYTAVDFGAVENKVKKVEYRKKTTGDYGSWTEITGKVVYGGGLFNNGSNQQIDDFVFGTEFTVEIKVSDELSFNVKTAVVTKGLFTMLVDNQVYGSIGIGEIPLEETNTLTVKGNIYAPNLRPSFTKLRLSGQFNINTAGNITNWTINSQYNSDLTTNGTNITLSKGIYRISGSLFYRHLAGAGALQASVYLVHNSTDISRIGISTTAVNSFVPVPFTNQIIEANGDTLKVRYEGFGTSGYLSASIDTYLNIEKIGD